MKIFTFLMIFCAGIFAQNLTDLQEWAKEIATQDVPMNKFRAYYLDKTAPKNVVASEVVDNITLNYAYADFHNIASQNFISYYVGNFEFKESVVKAFYLDISKAHAIVAVDDEIIIDTGARKKNNIVKLEKGRHKIEFWYINEWHTTSVYLDMKDLANTYQNEKVFADMLTEQDYEIYIASVYEGDERNSVKVFFAEKSQKPILLILNSHRATRWNIEPNGNEILGAVTWVANSVEGVKNIYYVNERLDYNYKANFDTNCKCINGVMPHCDGKLLTDDIDTVLKNYGKKPSAHVGEYQPKAPLVAPGVKITDENEARARKRALEIEEQMKKCSLNNKKDENSAFGIFKK